MKSVFLSSVLGVFSTLAIAQDWKDIEVPANAGAGKVWELQTNVSDDFNYTHEATDAKTNFGPDDMWYNFYHNQWDGPGTTYWKYNHVSVDEGNLILKVSRFDKNNQSQPYNNNTPKMDKANDGVNAPCITSHNQVVYPVFVETSLSVANISLASCFWLLSPDDTQEIDIIENYGDVDYFKQFTHISHHSFIRNPFHDYQPKDKNSWWPDARVNAQEGWGHWCWNDGDRRYLRLGVNWISPFHFEYYIDGNLVRVLYENAIATNINGTWEYTYYVDIHPEGTKDDWGNNIGGIPTSTNGYSDVVKHTTTSAFSFETLKETSEASKGINVIDPGAYQKGEGFTKPMDIIINVESQSWLASQGSLPTDADLQNPARNEMRVNWIRAYKPVEGKVEKITFPEASTTLGVGGTKTLEPVITPTELQGVVLNYTSNNPTVATVDENGKVTGISVGTAVITAKIDDVEASITVEVTDKITSSETLNTSNIILAPNPTQGKLRIDGLPSIELELTLYDLYGQLCFQQFIKYQNTHILHLEGFPSGVYIMQLKGENLSVSKKIIVS